MSEAIRPVIPAYITVHLGTPDSPAKNVTIPFTEYIKNVASSEIYPTWPESAIRANLYAIISFALNRIYTEWYRSKGYDFDITNSTQYDQAFLYQRDIFANISRIVDDIFNDYVVKQGSIEPYATKFCNGTTVTCKGLSQWGTVTDAKKGLSPYQILQKYYGKNIDIIQNAPVANIPLSYPGSPLRLGSSGNEVKTLQQNLNRISKNWPAITYIPDPDGIYGVITLKSVKNFQKIFGLIPDGIVGKSTWYKIKSVYNGVKQLSELTSEGLSAEEVTPLYPTILKEGMTGNYVKILQYYLDVIAYFNTNLSIIDVNGKYDKNTKNAVINFQKEYSINADGIVGRQTWNKITEVYKNILESLPPDYSMGKAKLYPGIILEKGMENSYIYDLQSYLSVIGDTYTQVPKPNITGYFGDQTYNSVIAFQNLFGLNQTGAVGPIVWNKIAQLYDDIKGFNE
ncbi:MAG: peptidoglycan-binding protein [Oscillospiraceae bacterium]